MSAPAQTLKSKKGSAPTLRVLHRGKKNGADRSSVRGTLTSIAVVVVLGGAILFGVLLEQVVLAQSAFELSRLRADLAKAESHHEELLLASAKLDNAARIERYARTSLGMVEPSPGNTQYVVADVRTGTSLAEETVNRANARHLGRAGVGVVEPASATGAGYEDSP